MRRRRLERIAALVCVALAFGSCGGGSLTLAEYAEEVDQAMAAMRFRILATDDALRQPVASLADSEAIWRERVAAREELLAALEAIDPPDQAAEIHAAGESILRRLADIEAGVADQVAAYDSLPELNGLTRTPAYREFLQVDDEANAICRSAQSKFDDTTRREMFADVPWIPGELQEVAQVMFGCAPAES